MVESGVVDPDGGPGQGDPSPRPADDDSPTGVLGRAIAPIPPPPGFTARGRARVLPRIRRRPRPAEVTGHRRRWDRQRLRTWEATAWIAALGVVALMVGFVIRSVPASAPVVADPTGPAGATAGPAGSLTAGGGPTADPSAEHCVIVGCTVAYPPGPPTRVQIPSIHVDSTLESLSRNAKGEINPPRVVSEAGWDTAGVMPGDRGPAVIAGHVDSVNSPGVFFELRTLKPDAIVKVERGGVWLTFRVTIVEEYPKDKFPTAKVYRPTPDPELRVITCGGDFDTVHGRYYDNIVVYAVLAP